jgi:hypothetical protein
MQFPPPADCGSSRSPLANQSEFRLGNLKEENTFAMNKIISVFKSDVTKWIGIVGGVITIIGNIEPFLLLSKWAANLIEHWSEWIHFFWLFVLPFQINSIDSSLLTINFFFVLNILHSTDFGGPSKVKIPNTIYWFSGVLMFAMISVEKTDGAKTTEILRPYLDWGLSVIDILDHIGAIMHYLPCAFYIPYVL